MNNTSKENKTKVAINGFGRIGRSVLKNIFRKYNNSIEIVAINDLSDPNVLVHLLKFDSVYGMCEKRSTCKCYYDKNILRVDGVDKGMHINLYAEKDPELLPWKELGVDVVLECTGFFRDFEGVNKHIKAGAKKVIISAPSSNPEKIPSFILGVNEIKYNHNNHHIVDMGSCTTNCLAPIANILHEHYVIESGMMTTIHSYTMGQNLLDATHKDLRRARAAAVNIVPTTTGAAKAIGRVIPELEGKIDGISVRVPTPTVSLIDLVVNVKKETTTEEVNYLFKKKSHEQQLKYILGVEDAPLVSSDYIGNSYSSVIDADMTNVKGKMIKILSWYDNEWGYATRLADFANYIGQRM